MRRENYGKWPMRFNLRLSVETARVYEEYAELTGAEVTGVLRMLADESAPYYEQMSEAIRLAKSGNASRAAEIVVGMAETFTASSGLHRARAEGLKEEIEAKRKQVGAPS